MDTQHARKVSPCEHVAEATLASYDDEPLVILPERAFRAFGDGFLLVCISLTSIRIEEDFVRIARIAPVDAAMIEQLSEWETIWLTYRPDDDDVLPEGLRRGYVLDCREAERALRAGGSANELVQELIDQIRFRFADYLDEGGVPADAWDAWWPFEEPGEQR